MSDVLFPRMMPLRQKFDAPALADIAGEVRSQFAATKVLAGLKPGASVAVGVGSRGISNLPEIVTAVLDVLKSAGAKPFIIPAMGSHGGATPEGQVDILAGYGISEKSLGVPVRAAMDVKQLGITPDGVPVHFSAEALKADAIIVINRVKPHTDFAGSIGSGVVKMLVIGLGKRTGAATCHGAAARLGHERVIRTVARVILGSAPVLCGVAIIENPYHQTAKISVVKGAEMEQRENELFLEAKALMPRLPFDDVDLLIVDRLGKNVSGSGMDPNVIGRGVQGYVGSLAPSGPPPHIRRIFVRGLTPETHGNAVGIGMADFTTTRLIRGMDLRVSYINCLTSLTPQMSKLPIHFDTDREVLEQALPTLALPDTREAKVVRIADTLSLARVEVSEAYAPLLADRADLEPLGPCDEMIVDETGNLPDVTNDK